jgi:integrase/recombinase XerC
MNQLVPIASPALPALIAAVGERARTRFLEFFAANIRNPHTRRAYYRAAEEFLAWCASAGLSSIAAVQPVHVATWIEALHVEDYHGNCMASTCSPVRTFFACPLCAK